MAQDLVVKNKLKTRLVERDDLDEIFQLLIDVCDFTPDPGSHDSIYEQFDAQEGCFAICAEVNDKVVGFASIFYITRIRGGTMALIEDVVVSREYRGQGIGLLLLKDLVTDAKNRGTSKITLETSEIAKALYKSEGFEEAGTLMKKLL